MPYLRADGHGIISEPMAQVEFNKKSHLIKENLERMQVAASTET